VWTESNAPQVGVCKKSNGGGRVYLNRNQILAYILNETFTALCLILNHEIITKRKMKKVPTLKNKTLRIIICDIKIIFITAMSVASAHPIL
jgi:hypothetical protein